MKQTELQIMRQLTQYRELLFDQHLHPVGLFLYGSQNYHMEQDGSDVDAYAVVLPDTSAFTYEFPVNKTIKTETGAIKAKDIRVFAQELFKGNYSTLESLVTPYRLIHRDYFSTLLDTPLSEAVLLYNPLQSIRSALGSVDEMKKSLLQTEQRAGKPDWKNLARIRHLHRFLTYALNGIQSKEDFQFALCGTMTRNDSVDPELLVYKDLKARMGKSYYDSIWAEEKAAMLNMDKKIRARYETWQKEIWPAQHSAIKEKQKQTRLQMSRWVTGIMVYEFLQNSSFSDPGQFSRMFCDREGTFNNWYR